MSDNRGGVFVAVAVFLVVVLICVFLFNPGFDAEAVIGGIGNLSDAQNPHNLSSDSAGIQAESEKQICIFCHTPHNAINDDTLLGGPLWNHRLSQVSSYTVNSPGQFFINGIGNLVLLTTPKSSPDGTSKMCLSCHDGTVSIGAVQSMANIVMVANSCLDADYSISSSCSSYIGTDLTRKHVVSVPMNQQLIDASAANCTVTGVTSYLKYPWDTSGSGYNYNAVLRPTDAEYPSGIKGISGDAAKTACGADPECSSKYASGYNYGVQCSTCHDPHFWVGTSNNSVPGYKFLNDGFNPLCKACHITPCP